MAFEFRTQFVNLFAFQRPACERVQPVHETEADGDAAAKTARHRNIACYLAPECKWAHTGTREKSFGGRADHWRRCPRRATPRDGDVIVDPQCDAKTIKAGA
jgi:hypothetical protein